MLVNFGKILKVNNKNFYSNLLIGKKKKIKFSIKFCLNYGLQLGGHVSSMVPLNSSVLFGIRFSNGIININKTLIELKKVLKIIEGIGFGRGNIFFVNSNIIFSNFVKSRFLLNNLDGHSQKWPFLATRCSN